MSKPARRVLGLTFRQLKAILEPRSAGSSLTIASAGGGKTTCVAAPIVQSLIADKTRALIINDVKQGEIAAQIGPMCKKYGRKFGIIDDSAVLGADNPDRLRLNPLDNVVSAFEQQSPDLAFEIENVSHTLIDEPKDDAKNKYFRDGPRELIEFGLRALLENSTALATPGGLSSLMGDPHSWNASIDVAAEEGSPALRQRALQLRELRDTDPEHYSQHLLAAQNALRIFQIGSPLHEAGRGAEMSHADLIRDHWIVCVVQSQRNAARLGPYYGLHFLSFMADQLSGNVGRADYVIDEFCNAPMRPLLNRVTVARAYEARFHFIAQSRADIERQYGQKDTAMLEENCTIKQYLKFSNFEEAERISKAMGEISNVSCSLGTSSEQLSWSQNYQTGRERMFTGEELMRLPADEQILHIADVGFIHCRKVRQNQIAPTCFDLADNPLEGGRLTPDPKVDLSAWFGGQS